MPIEKDHCFGITWIQVELSQVEGEGGAWQLAAAQLSLASPRVGCETSCRLLRSPPSAGVQEQVAAVSQTCTSNPLLDLRLTTEGSEDQN